MWRVALGCPDQHSSATLCAPACLEASSCPQNVFADQSHQCTFVFMRSDAPRVSHSFNLQSRDATADNKRSGILRREKNTKEKGKEKKHPTFMVGIEPWWTEP